MNSEHRQIHLFLRENAPVEFIKKTLTDALPKEFSLDAPEEFLFYIPDNKKNRRINQLFNPQLILNLHDSCEETRPYLLAAELLTLQYGRHIEIGEKQFPFYREFEFYTFLPNANGELPLETTLVFTEKDQQMLTKEENDYYFDFEHEHRINNELNKKYILWDSIMTRVAFQPFMVDFVDKGRTEHCFQKYIAQLIPVFEKYDLEHNFNYALPASHQNVKRI